PVRRALAAACVVAVLARCEATPRPPPATPGSARSGPVPTPASTVPARLPAVVLVADLSSPRARWDRVAFVPFGPGRGRLGVVTSRDLTPVPLVPPSFAVAPDGSLWFLDLVKRRLAHYSAEG